MTTTRKTYDTSPSSLTVTNLHSLGNDSWWQSAGLSNVGTTGDNTDGAGIVRIHLRIITTTTAASAVGKVTIYVAESLDGGTIYAGGASGSEGSYTITGNSNEQLRYVDSVAIDATETTARTYDFATRLVDVPKDYSFVVHQETGQALASSGNFFKILAQHVQTT